jgi:tetratricopeptide (TPR) repeat protein
MLQLRRTLILTMSTFFAIASFSQTADHPNRKAIDSLKKRLVYARGIERINCLNALAEEFWWWQFTSSVPDSVSHWALVANKESQEMNYALGTATSLMHLGVSEIFRENFLAGEKYIRQALQDFEKLNNDNGLGWCYAWLGQDLFAQMEFNESLDCYHKALSYFEKTDDWEGKGKAWAWMGTVYTTIGDYDNAVFFAEQSLAIRKQMSDHMCVARSLSSMGNFYKAVGANDEALSYYHQATIYADEHSLDYRLAERNFLFEAIGSFYGTLNRPDSSLFYLQKALQNDPGNVMIKIAIGETLLLKRQYDSALHIFLDPIERFSSQNDKWDLMRVLFDAGSAYAAKGNYTIALEYAYEGLSMAKATDVKGFIIKNYTLLSNLHANLHKSDSAYYYLKLSTALNNDLANGRFLFRLSNYKKQTEFNKQQEEIASLDKNNKLLGQANKVKEEKLKQASLIKWVFGGGLLIALLAALFIYISLTLKRKNEHLENQKAQSDLKLKASELEMQALRAQMNPHFIFNCLSSINHFILKNETDAASDYLTKFSRLIRIVLINSKNKLITLEDELEMLRLYLDMERLRFKNSFHYNINFINSLDVDNIYLPPLLLQPFAENAIWHGLLNKEGEGHLEISLRAESGFLICHVIDDGIGRKAAAEIKMSDEKKKSLGLKITRERFDLLNANDEGKTFFDFEDLVDENGNATGTKVILKIRIREAAYSLT